MRISVVVLLLSAAAGAQESNPGSVEIAKQRFALGDLLYRSEKYPEAIVEFEAARALVPRPDLDYNIARCWERLRQWDKALESYTRYVESTPTPLDAEQMLTHMEEIKEVRDQERRDGKMPPPLPPSMGGSWSPSPPPRVSDREAHRAGRGLRIAGLAVGVVGLVGVSAGIGFGVAAEGTANELTLLDRSMQRFDPSRDHDLSTQRALEGAFLGVGVAALVGGAVLFTVGHMKERRARRAHVAQSAAGVQVAF
jgi:tetratricopeptide (TPR) repeat protein